MGVWLTQTLKYIEQKFYDQHHTLQPKCDHGNEIRKPSGKLRTPEEAENSFKEECMRLHNGTDDLKRTNSQLEAQVR